MTNESININDLLSGVGRASGAGLLQEGQHVVTINDISVNHRKPERNGENKGWSDPTPEIVVSMSNADGAMTMWLNPIAYKRIEDITSAEVDALASNADTLKKLGLNKTQLKAMPFEQKRNSLFNAVSIDAQYNEDEFYAVRRDNNQRVIDPVRSEKGRQIMDRLAVHAGICAEGEGYKDIRLAKGKEIGIEVKLTDANKLKVSKTMLAEDVD